MNGHIGNLTFFKKEQNNKALNDCFETNEEFLRYMKQTFGNYQSSEKAQNSHISKH